LYQHGGFGGWSASFPTGDYDVQDMVARGGVNDDASSLAISGDCSVTLYKDSPFRGQSWTVNGAGRYDCCNIFGNDEVSSLRVHPLCAATLYQHGSFGGWSATFNSGNFDLAEMRSRGAVNDDASSLVISGDCSVTLYKDSQFQGQSWTLDGAGRYDCCNLFSNDEVSSLRVNYNGRGSGHRRLGNNVATDEANHALGAAPVNLIGTNADSTSLGKINLTSA
jgi:hypothetical protein